MPNVTGQRRTLPFAANNGATYTTAEIAFVEAFADVPTAEVAIALGRTLYAIETLKCAMRAGRARAAATPTTRRNAGTYRGWKEGDGDE